MAPASAFVFKATKQRTCASTTLAGRRPTTTGGYPATAGPCICGFKVTTHLLLFVAEGRHGIDAAGSACGNPASQRGDTQQNRGNADEDREFDSALGHRDHANRNYERKHPSNGRAAGDDTEVLANDLPYDATAGGPEREPHANLSGSPGDGIGNHGVDTDRREAK